MRILIVEDNEALADSISVALRKVGFAVDVLDNGDDAELVLSSQDFDAAILDLNLPGKDGLEVLKTVRARGRLTPVLILTARQGVEDRVTGLDLGADDYLCKPFELKELEARVRALLRRSQGKAAPVLAVGPLSLDSVGRRLYIDEEPVDLSRRELGVLEIMMIKAGKVVSKEQIAEHLFDFDEEVGLNAIEIYVHRVRKKIGDAAAIRTIRGLGYLLEKN
jgi:two-component system, OmpR family, response regulator